MGQLANRVAIVTGAAGGIGLAAAQRFIAEGAQVLLVDTDRDGLEKAVAYMNRESARGEVADVSSTADVERYVQSALSYFGGVDILVNNAAIEGQIGPLVEADEDQFDRVLAVNVRGVWLGLKYVIPQMEKRGGGSIIITSSVAGVAGYRNIAPYATSKHAVVGLMRAAALEYARAGIRINSVHPAPIETRMMQVMEEELAPKADNARDAIAATIPIGRYGTANEVAEMMLFLASDESRFCTGGTYMVDGGVTAGR